MSERVADIGLWAEHGRGYRRLDQNGLVIGAAAPDHENGASWSAHHLSGRWITGFATDVATARLAVEIVLSTRDVSLLVESARPR